MVIFTQETTKQTVLDNRLFLVRPDLIAFWDFDKNDAADFQTVTAGSERVMRWKCEKGHEWEAPVQQVNYSQNPCPYCANRRACADNSLAQHFPHLAKEWNHDRNLPLTPDSVTPGSKRKVNWICSTCNHEWDTTIKSRTGGTGCPSCSVATRKRTKSKISLLVSNPSLAKEWHPTNNDELTPNNVTAGSGKKVWWLCQKGHEWQATVSARHRGTGCAYCSNQKVSNDNSYFASQHPSIKEWHTEKNLPLTPHELTASSRKIVWWKCQKGHEWDTPLYARTNRDSKCPFCTNKRVCLDNCLATIQPILVDEWDFEKNEFLTPYEVTPMSDKTAWWLCKLGHSWKSQVKNRSLGRGCPKCNNNKTSYPEQYLHYFLSQVFATQNRKKIKTVEADIYLEQFSLAIEYDGVYWHKDQEEKERRKNKTFFGNGTNLLRIREDGLREISEFEVENIFIPAPPTDEDLMEITKKVFSYIESEFDISAKQKKLIAEINYEDSKNKIAEQINFLALENSLASVCPQVVKFWHPIKNGNLLPEYFLPSSNRKVWWACEKGHEWERAICASKESGCPYCSQILPSSEYNFAFLHPTLAAEWNLKKNGFAPEEVTPSSAKKVWWACKENHEWECTVDSRSSGSGCPYCSGRRATKDKTLAVLFPNLSKQWDLKMNYPLTPSDVGKGTHKKVWWTCDEGHSWQAVVYSRTRTNEDDISISGCRKCAKKKKLQNIHN